MSTQTGGGQRRSPLHRLTGVLVLAASVAYGAACAGAARQDRIFDLRLTGLEYVFVAVPGTLQAGTLVTVPSVDSLDLAARLRERGFRPEEVVSATLVDPQLLLEQPAAAGVGLLDEVRVRVGQGEGAVEVATRTRFGGLAGRTPLDPAEGDLAAVFRAPAGAELAVRADAADPAAFYRFRVRFSLDVEVRAF
ncbi:MAG: hypothetical protein ACK41D_12105 [Rubricoccaceae bacterium]